MKRSIDRRKVVKKMEWFLRGKGRCWRRTNKGMVIKRCRRMINRRRRWWSKFPQNQIKEYKALRRCKVFILSMICRKRRGSNITSMVYSYFIFEVIAMKRRGIITRINKRSKNPIVKFIFNNIKNN